MFIIKIPAPSVNADPVTGAVIMRKTPEGGEEPDAFSFAWWLHNIVFQHPTWSKEAKAIRAMVRIDKALRRAKPMADAAEGVTHDVHIINPQMVMMVETEDLAMLKDCAENPQMVVDGRPQAGYPAARLAQLCLPHIDAVANAIEEK
jgi:hypothetical protein